MGADRGKTIKVKVSFTDDASNPETLTSTATAAVAAAANTPATGAPAITGAAQVGQTLTAGTTAIGCQRAEQRQLPRTSGSGWQPTPHRLQPRRHRAIASRRRVLHVVAAGPTPPVAVTAPFHQRPSITSVTASSTGSRRSSLAAAVVVPNNPPAFSADTAARSVAENTAAGQNVGAALTATDADSDTLTYTLEGTDAASFDIVSGSGQIRTRTGVTYNHEAKSTHTVVVKADDGNGGTDTIAVTITVTDVDEPPGQPAAPSVSATAGSTTSLDVTWTAPTNTGPAIASYDLQYRAGTSGNFTDGPQNVTGTSAAIGSLAADTSYEVQVRATNAEGDGDWSVAGTGRTTATSAPGAPTGLTATASGTTADRPLLERPGQHRRLRHHRLQDRGLAQRHLRLDRPGRQHQQHRHDLRPHRAGRRRHPPLPRLRHQRQRRRHRLQRRQRHHRTRSRRRQRPGHGAGPRTTDSMQPLLERSRPASPPSPVTTSATEIVVAAVGRP